MNKRYFVLGLILMLLMGACKEEQIDFKGSSVDFGNSEYYSPFLWVKSDTILLTKKLNFEFNGYAKEMNSEVLLQLVDEDENIVDSNKIQLIVDGLIQSKNSFEISSNENSGVKEIALKILPGYKDGFTTGFLKIQNHSLDVINNTDLNVLNELRVFKWEAQYNIIMNPLKKGVIWFFGLIFLGLFVWFLILRNFVFPKFKSGKLQVLSPYFGGVRLSKNTRMVVFTNKAEKQSILNIIFSGKIQYEVNPIYDSPWILRPGRGNKIRTKLPAGLFITPPTLNLEKFNKYSIKTANTIVEVQYS